MSRPEFVINRPGSSSVADGLNELLAGVRGLEPKVSISTAYFNVDGYQLLADELDQAAGVRIMLGAEPTPTDYRLRRLADRVSPARAARHELRRALEGVDLSLETARDLLGFTSENDMAAQRLVAWLRSGTVEVRRFEAGFLHGKAFIVSTKPVDGVVAGSSNFTRGGLVGNLELNLGQYQPSVVKQVSDWFDELWTQAQPFDLAAMYESRFSPHEPQLVYLRMLYERYSNELRLEAEARGSAQIHLARFQEDGLWRAARILESRDGVLIADEVGLGKTFIAGELIRQAVQERRQRVLVIAPKTLRDGPWRKFLSRFNILVECRSFEDVASDFRLNPTSTKEVLNADPAEYALVVVDEAHNFRNPSAQRSEALRRLILGSPPTKLVLMTATPVNNSLWDLYYLLGFFVKNDGAFADVGIRSLRDHFSAAMRLDPEDLTPEHLFDVLDSVAVRRTRSFVKRHYPTDTIEVDGQPQTITFPTPRVKKVSYDLEAVLPGFFDRFAHSIDSPGAAAASRDLTVIAMARYAPSQYRLDGQTETYELQLAGLLRSGLLKRFESSAFAFARTCEKMARSHEAFLALLDRGHVATGAVLAEWIATDADDEEAHELFVSAYTDVLDDAALYDTDALRADVENDRDLLRSFAEQAAEVLPAADPKLQALIEELAVIAAEAEAESVNPTQARDRRKVLVFSYFADTVDWIADYLEETVRADPRLAAYAGRIARASGTSDDRDDVLWGFAPKTTDAPGNVEDAFDIVVATDVLAEGVNLQQARHIINYDLPWNPMRLVQRHGRIDRIGSSHAEVFMRCVFPDEKLDELLGLEVRLQRKIKQAAAAVGVSEVLPGTIAADISFSESRDEIERLRLEDPSIFIRGGTGRSAMSGEEFRQELRRGLEDQTLAATISKLPWGSGSGMVAVDGALAGGGPGYVFCARVADHDRPLFRFVDLSNPESPSLEDDTLACLDRARPPLGYETPRVLGEAVYASAFEAWKVARESILREWNHLADPANLAVAVPPAMQRAAELVVQVSPSDSDSLVDVLQAAYPERILREVRAILGSGGGDTARVDSLRQLVIDRGLTAPEPVQELPEIEEDDIHLVCWMALAEGESARDHAG
jgi:hypothetical protein